MSAVLAANLPGEFPDRLEDDVFDEEPEDIVETPQWEPRRVRVPKLLVWGTAGLFFVAILAMSIWGLAHSTWWYEDAKVGPTTSSRLAQIHRKLLAAGVPETSLINLAIAAQPDSYVDQVCGALVSADRDLEKLGSNAAVASARAELQDILANLCSSRFIRNSRFSGGKGFSATYVPTLWVPTPQP